jgi:glutathione S-transferase
MLTIYGRKSSANVQKVHWICLEGNLEFKAINIGGKYGGHTSPEFKQINPNSTIPVIKDNDFIIYESNSIIKYISDKYNILKSNNQKDIALNNQWIDWASLVFGLQCATYTAHNMLLPVEQRNPTIASETKKKIIKSFEILDNQFNKYNFILNDKLSLADIPIGCWLHRCVILDLKFSEFKSLDRWYRKLEENEAFNIAVISAPLPPN